MSWMKLAWLAFIRRGWELAAIISPVSVLFVLVTMLFTLESYISRANNPARDSRTLRVGTARGQFDQTAATRIAQIRGVVEVSPLASIKCALERGGKQIDVSCSGVTSGFLEFLNRDMSPELLERWKHQANGAIVGRELAEEHGWQEGQRVHLILDGKPIEFTVTAVLQRAMMLGIFWIHTDFVDRLRDRSGYRYSSLWVTVDSAENRARVQEEIWAKFENTPTPAQVMTGEATRAMVLSFSNLLLLLFRGIGLLAITIVAFTTMTLLILSIERRRSELATLRAIGFRRGFVFRLVLAEAVLLVVPGALLGSLFALLCFGGRAWVLSAFVRIQVTFPIAMVASSTGLLLALLLSLIPARQAARSDVLSSLRGH